MPALLSPATRLALLDLLRRDDERSGDAEPGSGTALGDLAAIRSLQAALDADPAALRSARAAEAAGADWEEIGRAAGLKAAAARWRWHGDDAEIAARHEAGRRRAARPSSAPVDLPGLSVAEAAARLGVTVQAVYLRVSRGRLRAETVSLPDGRSYKRIHLDDPAPE